MCPLNQLDRVLASLRTRWEGEGLVLQREPEDRIREVFLSFGVEPSNTLLRLYRDVGGMVCGNMDDDNFTLWPLARLVEENNSESIQARLDRGLLFADYLIWSWGFRVQCNSSSEGLVCIDGSSRKMEPHCSLPEFLDNLVHDPNSVLL